MEWSGVGVTQDLGNATPGRSPDRKGHDIMIKSKKHFHVEIECMKIDIRIY